MRSRKLFGSVAVAAAVALPLSACGASSDAAGGDSVALRVASNSNTSALPMWVADKKNLCEDHGIDLQFQKIENIGTLPPALGKSFDVIFTTPVQAIMATSEGIPVTQVAGASIETPENEASYLMTNKDSGITDLSQLEGKRLGVLTEVGTLHYSTLLLLKKAGVPLDSLEIVQVDGPVQADQLKAKRVDAVETVRPFNKALAASGAVNIGTPFSSLGDTISPIWWGAGHKWTKENPKVVEDLQACLTDAIDFIEENDAEARDIMQEYTGLPAEIAESFELPQYDASVRPDDTAKWLDGMREVVNFKEEIDLDVLSAKN